MDISDKDLCRFMSKIYFFDRDKCWNWTGAKHVRGYGTFKYRGTNFRAHRFSYLIAKGEIPTRFSICHSCDTPSCVNPDHLVAGTHSQNMRESVLRKRHRHSKQTHCKSGHELIPENLIKLSSPIRSCAPLRMCKICHKLRARNKVKHKGV